MADPKPRPPRNQFNIEYSGKDALKVEAKAAGMTLREYVSLILDNRSETVTALSQDGEA